MTEAAQSTVCALTIAGLDPSGGAGVIADTRAIASLGVYPLAVVTAITFQNTTGVTGCEALDAATVGGQLDALLEDMKPSAVKTGMLPDPEIVFEVANRTESFGRLVIDPVARSSSGAPLASGEALAAVKKELLPKCALVTPNLEEAREISGMEINSRKDAEDCARAILEMGAGAVCITGGHWDEGARDLFHEGGEFTWFGSGERIDLELHGTGCFFSATATAGLARGLAAAAAVEQAGELTLAAIKNAVIPGAGMAVPLPR